MWDEKEQHITPQRVSTLPKKISLKEKIIKFEAPSNSVPLLYIAAEKNTFAKYPIPPHAFGAHNLPILKANFTFFSLDDNDYVINFDAFFQTDKKYKPFESSRTTTFLDEQLMRACNTLYAKDYFFKNAADRRARREENERNQTKTRTPRRRHRREKQETGALSQFAEISTVLNKMNKGKVLTATGLNSIGTTTQKAANETPNLNPNSLSVLQQKPEFSNLLFSSIVDNFSKCDENLALMLSDPEFIKQVCRKMKEEKQTATTTTELVI